MTVPVWAGVDVGGPRKGFHVAAVDEGGVVLAPRCLQSVQSATDLVLSLGPVVIGIDSPCRPAPPGERSRACERELVRAVCGIRYTPDAHTIAAGGNYYGWIRNGLLLYEALATKCRLAEVFPTASWTRLYGPRGSTPRGAWSRAALASLGLNDVPTRRLSQDDRDAIGAAWTARLCSKPGAIEWFGDIAVPA